MDPTALLINKVLFPAWVVKNASTRLSYATEFERTQFWSADAIRELQWRQFRRLLQHAFDHPCRLDTEVLAELRVERFRQVGRSDLAREHLALELEAQDDMERVRHLVGIDAGHGRRDPVERTMEILQPHVSEPLRKRLLESREEEAPRREAAPDDVLPQPALRLVEG